MLYKISILGMLIAAIILFVSEIFSEAGADFSETMLFVIAWSILMKDDG